MEQKPIAARNRLNDSRHPPLTLASAGEEVIFSSLPHKRHLRVPSNVRLQCCREDVKEWYLSYQTIRLSSSRLLNRHTDNTAHEIHIVFGKPEGAGSCVVSQSIATRHNHLGRQGPHTYRSTGQMKHAASQTSMVMV